MRLDRLDQGELRVNAYADTEAGLSAQIVAARRALREGGLGEDQYAVACVALSDLWAEVFVRRERTEGGTGPFEKPAARQASGMTPIDIIANTVAHCYRHPFMHRPH